MQTEKKNYPGVTNQEETKNVVVATVKVSWGQDGNVWTAAGQVQRGPAEPGGKGAS